MDPDALPRDPASRRSFLRALGIGAVGGTAVLLGACVGAAAPSAARADAEGDAAILNSALDLEEIAIAAYRAGLPRLDGDLAATGRHFLEQEREHAEALRGAIRDLGGRPNRSRPAELPQLRDGRAVLRFAAELERTFVAAYLDMLPRLHTKELRRSAAAILTNEAEHIAVIEAALGEEPARSAFVTGTPA
jgi:rubrerythrin